jgi:hypothetical protein
MERQLEWEGIAAVAIGKFGDEQIVADQQRVFHRAGRDVERLEEKCPHHERKHDRFRDDDERTPGFAEPGLRFVAGHAHLRVPS